MNKLIELLKTTKFKVIVGISILLIGFTMYEGKIDRRYNSCECLLMFKQSETQDISKWSEWRIKHLNKCKTDWPILPLAEQDCAGQGSVLDIRIH